MTTRNEYNQSIIEEFRNNGGKTSGGLKGAPLLLLHTKGGKSGQPRMNPLVYMHHSDRGIVFASKGGEPTSPD